MLWLFNITHCCLVACFTRFVHYSLEDISSHCKTIVAFDLAVGSFSRKRFEDDGSPQSPLKAVKLSLSPLLLQYLFSTGGAVKGECFSQSVTSSFSSCGQSHMVTLV